MGKYCCFFCPKKDYEDKLLSETCPTCGRSYGFMLTNPPIQIDDYRIIKDLGRGYYGATYIAEKGSFKKKFVIKISPVNFYSHFQKKSFELELEQHTKLAENASHIVGIYDGFEKEIEFSDKPNSKLKCYVTVLDFVNGVPLREYISGNEIASSTTICQIAIDLLRLRDEFANNHLNHNDLHADNLIVEHLRSESYRVDAIDPKIRVKAIDLGSVSDESKSSEDRAGDIHFIVNHVDGLLNRLLSNTIILEDRDYRIALALQCINNGMRANVENFRQPISSDLTRPIEEAVFRAINPWKPWSNRKNQNRFSENYNAQTLDSWNVPRLIVDPDNRWLERMSITGPQIVTGMRGCGKTMLLKSLDIHARAAEQENENRQIILDRIKDDGFIGLFLSAQRLLDLRPSDSTIESNVSRLFIHYCLEAIKALFHLKDIDGSIVVPHAHRILGNAISDCIEGADYLRDSFSLEDLENQLSRIAVLSWKGSINNYVRQAAPANIFVHLGEQLRLCSCLISSSKVLFLLDDVSTRYLDIGRIAELISTLLFQNSSCAFKMTSEWQALDFGIQSPGRNHPIRIGRDVDLFDLGADVLTTLKKNNKLAAQFIEDILEKRAKCTVAHPFKFKPSQLLGDMPLTKVAEQIANPKTTPTTRKQIYQGLTCLMSVCVGDIGDIIMLYESIINNASTEKSSIPISPSIQSECFLDLSARRIFELNKRNEKYKDHALSFANAAHELLIKSYRQGGTKSMKQYFSIYVRITSDDKDTQQRQVNGLRELIDAGVFVYSGGAPRTKSKDKNPFQQFKLSYRKILGLQSFISLSDRHRFELSGADLQQWLENPTKDILVKNQYTGKDIQDIDSTTEIDAHPMQHSLFPDEKLILEEDTKATVTPILATPIDLDIKKINNADISSLDIKAVITGLGFEDRTLFSNKFLARNLTPDTLYAIRYNAAGHKDEIYQAWKLSNPKIMELLYSPRLMNIPEIEGLALIDVSGLSKTIIFNTIRRELISKGRVIVCHVSAEHYYPLNKDIEKLFEAEKSGNKMLFIDKLSQVLQGEYGPYEEIRLIDDYVDISRNRTLLAFSSAKHERLLSLVRNREFDSIEIITPTGEEPRTRVAHLVANDFISQNYQNVKISRVDSSNLQGLVKHMDEQFIEIYIRNGSNLEIGLTGSKMQAVASAILSVKRKVSQAWYLSPKEFDENRFTTGVGEARIFDIQLF